MNKLFTTPRIPELIISYPCGGMITAMGNVPGNLVQNELPGNYKTQRLKVLHTKVKRPLGGRGKHLKSVVTL